MEFLKDWASLILSAIAIGTTAYAWLTSGSKEALAEITDLKEEIGKSSEKLALNRETTAAAVNGRFKLVEDRVLALETEFKHLPDREQVHRIEVGLSDLNGKFEVISERLKPVQAIADRLQELEFERANGN
jgi:hypothetical protein